MLQPSQQEATSELLDPSSRFQDDESYMEVTDQQSQKNGARFWKAGLDSALSKSIDGIRYSHKVRHVYQMNFSSQCINPSTSKGILSNKVLMKHCLLVPLDVR